MVIDNANTVRAAALAFEAQNGQFPNEVNELQPFLPGGELLVNPYVGAATEPVDGAAALSGQIGYQPVYAQSGSVHGYHITGFGETEEIVHLFFDPAGP
ncbi:MAG: hypothetical protein R3284_09530 [Rubricoccaceae bacterium]|nr:hypothetical protein [Rubricoccaceae bacterium]